jgi:hypothetical protein
MARDGVPDCAANHDGTSVAYEWTSGGSGGSASSCTHPIDPLDSLPVGVDSVARAVSP